MVLGLFMECAKRYRSWISPTRPGDQGFVRRSERTSAGEGSHRHSRLDVEDSRMLEVVEEEDVSTVSNSSSGRKASNKQQSRLDLTPPPPMVGLAVRSSLASRPLRAAATAASQMAVCPRSPGEHASSEASLLARYIDRRWERGVRNGGTRDARTSTPARNNAKERGSDVTLTSKRTEIASPSSSQQHLSVSIPFS